MDLATLWYLTTGTLLVAAAMTLWERKAQVQRARELGLFAAAYAVFAVGCVLAMNRGLLPGVAGPAVTNVVMMLGYFLALQGVLALDGKRLHPGLVTALLAAIAAAWFAAGGAAASLFWNHVSAFPIAIVCAFAALSLLRSPTAAGLRSRPIAIAAFTCHALFYAARTFAAPFLAARYGHDTLSIIAEITMYEAVLFIVTMSMSVLALVREEDRARLLATARTDFLTGLCNRQGFFELAPARLSQAAHKPSSALLAIDLDHFKTINDRYGHEAGDRVLKLFADIVREIACPKALSARLGGEEFAVLLPGSSIDDAHVVGCSVAARFAEAVAQHDGLGIPATVSIGLAESVGSGDLGTLLAEADRALYRAKMAGRNRVEIAAPRQIAKAA